MCKAEKVDFCCYPYAFQASSPLAFSFLLLKHMAPSGCPKFLTQTDLSSILRSIFFLPSIFSFRPQQHPGDELAKFTLKYKWFMIVPKCSNVEKQVKNKRQQILEVFDDQVLWGDGDSENKSTTLLQLNLAQPLCLLLPHTYLPSPVSNHSFSSWPSGSTALISTSWRGK